MVTCSSLTSYIFRAIEKQVPIGSEPVRFGSESAPVRTQQVPMGSELRSTPAELLLQETQTVRMIWAGVGKC